MDGLGGGLWTRCLRHLGCHVQRVVPRCPAAKAPLEAALNIVVILLVPPVVPAFDRVDGRLPRLFPGRYGRRRLIQRGDALNLLEELGAGDEAEVERG